MNIENNIPENIRKKDYIDEKRKKLLSILENEDRGRLETKNSFVTKLGSPEQEKPHVSLDVKFDIWFSDWEQIYPESHVVYAKTVLNNLAYLLTDIRDRKKLRHSIIDYYRNQRKMLNQCKDELEFLLMPEFEDGISQELDHEIAMLELDIESTKTHNLLSTKQMKPNFKINEYLMLIYRRLTLLGYEQATQYRLIMDLFVLLKYVSPNMEDHPKITQTLKSNHNHIIETYLESLSDILKNNKRRYFP